MLKLKASLIKRGGGTGPMKPGNRQLWYGANSCREKPWQM